MLGNICMSTKWQQLPVEGEQDPANRCIGSRLNIISTMATPMGSTVGHVAQHCLLTQMIT